MAKSLKYTSFIIILFTCLPSCTPGPGTSFSDAGRGPVLDPDYTGITIPFNIAPLNFIVREKGTAYEVKITAGSETLYEIRSGSGIIRIPERAWKNTLAKHKGELLNMEVFVKEGKGKWLRYATVTDTISGDPIDKYLTYRILYPGYESWKEISIRQRDLESFRERPLIENSIADQNCINCHSFNDRTGSFLVHIRGSLGGTLFYDGKTLQKINLKTKEMKNGAVYPRWHPSGKFVAFSSNRIIQQFHSALPKKVEVSDLESSLMLYNVGGNSISDIDLTGSGESMDTYPEWSPDGKWLYFCRAKKPGIPFEYNKVHYDLYRASFDSSRLEFGIPEMVYNASGAEKSVSFPRLSPDGRHLVFTLHNYGVFPVWHREADLYSLDLSTMNTTKMTLNSDFTESYHSWSSDSKWLVFSSKRLDGLTARLFIAHIDSGGNSGKPFILPQHDPRFYSRFIKTYNLPELSVTRIGINPGKFRKAMVSRALPALWGNKN